MKELAEASNANSLTSHSTENIEYRVKLLDKQRPVAIYHLGNFITKHIILYAKSTLRSSCIG